MLRLIQLLKQAPALIVSLPANDARLARAAVAGGAQALKVHIRMEHQASGTRFGTLDQEQGGLQEILREAEGVPVGIVTGAEDPARPAELETLAQMGLDFFDMYAHHMPPWMLEDTPLTRVMAIDHTYTAAEISGLPALGMEILEAAVIPHQDYGRPLNARDLARYHQLRQAVGTPIILPTQLKLTPAEAALLAELGMEGIMIGAIVTDREPASIERETKRFRRALERIS